jgi:hypothetical protein
VQEIFKENPYKLVVRNISLASFSTSNIFVVKVFCRCFVVSLSIPFAVTPAVFNFEADF